MYFCESWKIRTPSDDYFCASCELVDYQSLLYQTIRKQPIWKTDGNRFLKFIVVLLLIYLKFVNIHERRKGLFLCLRQFLTTESPLKIMKNAFYLIFKALYCLKIFTFFCLDFLVTLENSLIRKIISKFMTPQTRQLTITIDILPHLQK